MTKAEKIQFINKHLFYELRMLLGASEIVTLFDKHDMGNVSSLVRDSAYVHIRNLYNFFSSNTRNDIGVHEFINLDFDLRLYRTWEKVLHRNVLHVDKKRRNIDNKVNGIPISKMVHKYANDIVKNWELWIENEQDAQIKKKIEGCLEKACKESKEDHNNAEKKLT